MNVQQKQQKGFTIIEVILVLAIAGLIFLMVFLALPALQRGQRDTQRKQDLSRVLTAVQNYQSNNKNGLPTFNDAFITSYLKAGTDTFEDPSGTAYSFVTAALPATYDSSKAQIKVTTGAVCDGEALKDGQGAKKVALQMKLEGSGVACENN